MADHDQGRSGAESNFSFAVSELRKARTAPKTGVGSAPLEMVKHENPGFDPYNSGGFDRNNNWTRVGRR